MGTLPTPSALDEALAAALSAAPTDTLDADVAWEEGELDPFEDLGDIELEDAEAAASFRHVLALIEANPGLRITFSFA
jgi:hypothetical protein